MENRFDELAKTLVCVPTADAAQRSAGNLPWIASNSRRA
jgi:hypothetical protein